MSLPQPLSPATSTSYPIESAADAQSVRPQNPDSIPREVPHPDPATGAVRAGVDCDVSFGAVIPPLYLSSNFSFEGYGEQRRYDYTRSGNPTRDLLASTLAELEGGTHGVVTSSGMSAIHLVLQALEPGARVVASHDCYGGTHRLLSALDRKKQLEVRFADLTRVETLEAELEGADLVWVETPSNPLLRIVDIAAISRTAHRRGGLVAVDNTFLSPVGQRPLLHGADLVAHSTTKYLNGHSDVVGGAVVTKDAELGERLGWWANCLGLTGSPFDAYLTQRGLRTLNARFRVHQENAAAVVERLAGHEAVSRVFYPGLTDHPGHGLAKRQQEGFGAIVSFELRGGEEAVRGFLSSLRLFTLAESLGGVESLVAHPATMTHAAMDPEARRRAGLGDGLLRLSVGIEAAADLLADLGVALDRAAERAEPSRLDLPATVGSTPTSSAEPFGGVSCAS